MNTKKKIERCLRIAPKPPASGGLLDRLRQDFSATEIKARSSAIRRWFAPTDDSISLWRVAAVAAIGIAVLLPLSYGAVKVVKYVTTYEFTFEYPEDNITYGASDTVIGDNINTEEEARKAVEEFCKLYNEGKAREVEAGVWVATLSNGEEFAFAGDPELADLPDAEKKELLQKQFDEINELRKAGKYHERIFLREIEKDGVRIRLYQDSFILSNGKLVTLTTAQSKEEPAKDEDED
jgi:hypothetical protein